MKISKTWLGISAVIVACGIGAVYVYSNGGTTTSEDANEVTNVVSSTDKSIATIVQESPELSTLKESLAAADLTGVLDASGEYTLFAPTNKAFEALPAETQALLDKPEAKAALANILKYHLLSTSTKSDTLTNATKLKTLLEQEIVVATEGEKLYVVSAKGDKALITKKDVSASNGTIHIINMVLLPQ